MSEMWIDDFLESGTIVSTEQEKVLIGWGRRQWLKNPSHRDGFSFFFPDYFMSSKHSWFTHESYQEFPIEGLIQIFESLKPRQEPPISWTNPKKEHFAEAFCDLQEKFVAGSLRKGVPYVFETAAAAMTRGRLQYSLLNLLRHSQSHPVFIYGFWGREQGILGGTPELLFRITHDAEQTHVSTEACAGTCAKKDAWELSGDSKELHEHNLVVEGIFESLYPFGKVRMGKMKTLELDILCHLVTPMEVEIVGTADFQEILEALHPTPALGTYPKEEGMEWAKKYQVKMDRNRYGAPMGFYCSDTQESTCYVAIRNAQWSQKEIRIGAGCGIVPQSQLDLEWDEVLLKIQSIKELLAL